MNRLIQIKNQHKSVYENVDIRNKMNYNVVNSRKKGRCTMANRMVLNETSYIGSGAITHIVDEVKLRGYKKALVVTDKDLIKFNIVQRVT